MNRDTNIIDGFDNEWEKRYSQSDQLSIWPWSDLVSYIKRNAEPKNGFIKVLELGCGAGANIPFFLNGYQEYYAIDGSSIIVNNLKKKFPEISERIICDDFTKTIPFNFQFDLIFDRAGLTCNDTKSISRCLSLVKKSLRKNGIYIGIDWYSKSHSDSSRGIKIDEFTQRGIESGSFAGLGNVHFSSEDHLVELFSNADFKITLLEHKKVYRIIGENSSQHCSYNFVAMKL